MKKEKIKETKTEKKAKEATKKVFVKKKTETPVLKGASVSPKIKEKYFEAVGRRKTAIARVRLFTQRTAKDFSEGETIEKGILGFSVNNKPIENYFPSPEVQMITKSALEKMNCLGIFRVSVIVRGGGLRAQSEAIRHGIARALVLFNPEFRKRLKKAGFLKRDPRMRERKKFGLKRARRAPQWQKR